MKKLMIALSALAVAVSAQAGSVKWTMMNIYDGNAEDKASGNAYLFTYTGSGYTEATIGAAIQSAWDDGYGGKTGAAGLANFLNAKALGKDGAAYTWTGSNGTYSKSTGLPDNADLGLIGDTNYKFYMVMFNDEVANFNADTAFLVSTEKDGKTKGDASTDSLALGWAGGMATPSKSADNWSAVSSAPEPTSGLLLLLGVAGLALRRRRA